MLMNDETKGKKGAAFYRVRSIVGASIGSYPHGAFYAGKRRHSRDRLAARGGIETQLDQRWSPVFVCLCVCSSAS